MNENKLKTLRIELGLSPEEFSKKTSFFIKPTLITFVESGRRKLTILQEMAICKAFNLPEDYFN